MQCLRCDACGAVPAVRCLQCGTVRCGTTVHRMVGMSWASDPAAPTLPTDEGHPPLAGMHPSRIMPILLHEHAFHDHVSQTYM